MHYEILDDARRELLPSLEIFKSRFYLAGGTALALQIGHRDSIDFDFFTDQSFDTARLFSECLGLFGGHTVLKTQDEKDSLGIIVDDSISISFMRFSYSLIRPLIDSDHLALASIEDIACMKFSAITGRSTMKDYVDLYYILELYPLADLLMIAATKLPTLDRNLILKSLVYFDDISTEPIRFVPDKEVTLEQIKLFLQSEVKKIL